MENPVWVKLGPLGQSMTVVWFAPDSYKEEGRRIYLGDGSHIESVGSGTVELKFGTHSITLLSALHVPKLAGNLVSISRLDFSGISTTFADRRCVLRSDVTILATIPSLQPLPSRRNSSFRRAGGT